MRTFLTLLIIVIGFSGFSTATFACADMPNHQTEKSNADPSSDTAAHKKSGDGVCLDCTHCCVSHALHQSFQLNVRVAPLTLLNAPPVYEYRGEYIFSLLRPPKTLA